MSDIDRAMNAQAEHRAGIVRALTGQPAEPAAAVAAEPEPESTRTPSFDGGNRTGARDIVAPAVPEHVESTAEMWTRVLRAGKA